MTSLTHDVCPSCGAWLVLVEVLYVAPTMRRYPDVGSRVVTNAPAAPARTRPGPTTPIHSKS